MLLVGHGLGCQTLWEIHEDNIKESKERTLSDFDESTCSKHIKNVLKLKQKNESFEFDLSSLKRLNNPMTELDQSPTS